MKNLKKTSSVFIVLILIFALLAVTAVRAVDVVVTISLKLSGGYYGLAYDSRLGEIFVTNGDYNLVYVISDSTNTVVATIPVGSVPYGLAYDSGKGELFVTYSESNGVSVISNFSDISVSPTATVSELNGAFILVITAAVVTLCAIVFAKKDPNEQL